MRIINASKRTDLPAFYAEDLANIMNVQRDDFFILWTKNITMLASTGILNLHKNWYVQHTLTGYNEDLEPHIQSKKYIIKSIRELSIIHGFDRFVIRYDPIVITERYTVAYHIACFAKLCTQLEGYIDTITFSFLDWYKNIPKDLLIPSIHQQVAIAEAFSKIAKEHGIFLSTCAESIDLSKFDIAKAQCVDPYRIEKISGNKIENKNSAYQRKECGCIKAEDIGSYKHKCYHGCKYCYANHN